MTSFPPRMQVVVGGAVQRGNELLFVRQTYGEFKGQWCFPSGYVDSGEQPEAATMREVLEESGIKTEVAGLISLVTIFEKGEPMLYLIFLCRYVSGDPTPDGGENDAAAFLSLDDMNGLAEPIEAQNGWLARRIFAGDYQVMLPFENNGWNAIYLNAYA